MNLFRVPLTEYSDHYDLARFNLSWRVCYFMVVVLTVLGGMLFLLGQPAYVPTVIGAVSVGIFLFILKKTRKYGLVAGIFCLLGTALCQYTLIYYLTQYHMVDVLWIMVIVLYTFFMLGKNWGVVILSLNVVGILLFVFLRLNDNLLLLGELKEGEILALGLNFLICGLLIAFLILQFLNVIKKAENDLRSLNDELMEQNTTVAHQNQEKTVMLSEIHHRVRIIYK